MLVGAVSSISPFTSSKRSKTSHRWTLDFGNHTKLASLLPTNPDPHDRRNSRPTILSPIPSPSHAPCPGLLSCHDPTQNFRSVLLIEKEIQKQICKATIQTTALFHTISKPNSYYKSCLRNTPYSRSNMCIKAQVCKRHTIVLMQVTAIPNPPIAL